MPSNRYDFEEVEESIANILEVARLFEKSRERKDNILIQIEQVFVKIWLSIRGDEPLTLKDRANDYDLTLFRKSLDIVASAPTIEIRKLRIWQDRFIEVYLDYHWDPELLKMLMIRYSAQFNDCYRYIKQEENKIEQLICVGSLALTNKNIKGLLNVMDKDIWSTLDKTKKDLSNQLKEGMNPSGYIEDKEDYDTL